MIIGICDDEKMHAEKLELTIREFLERKDEDYEIRLYSNGYKLLEEVEDLEVVFLDVMMPEMDGLATGRKLRKINDECRLIYVTGYELNYKETAKMYVFRYITKPYERKEIEEAIDACLRTRLGNETIDVFLNRIPHKITQKSIEYIVGNQGGYVDIKSGKNWYRKDISLKMLEEQLNPILFCKIHRKYIVNLARVIEYRNGIINIRKVELKTSFRRKKYFEEKYYEFIRKMV